MKDEGSKKTTVTQIRKRDGRVVPFDQGKITEAIWKAARSIGGKDRERARFLSDKVVEILEKKFDAHSIPGVEEIQDIVEKVLIEHGHARTAKAYILYRDMHNRLRDINSLIDTDELMDNYLTRADWRVKENSNMAYSLQGLNNHVFSTISARYWLNKIYLPDARDAHVKGELHIHNLQLLAPYCCGWDLKDLLVRGFGGVSGKIECRPPKHFRVALGQIVNFLYTLQGEIAGAVAFSNFDTFLAPFLWLDKLTEREVEQSLQEFIFNANVPTRVGFQTPFTNITLDLTVPSDLKEEYAIVGGKPTQKKYGEFQTEMDMINRCLARVYVKGDAKGRVFTFPIPTYNIAKDFDWDNKNLDDVWEMTAKYGIPYFANFVNSDMDPSDARSMCCRLRLDKRELRKRGGGLFGANPLTGSIGVVTINMARIGYLAKDERDFFERLEHLMLIAKDSLVSKRKVLEAFTEQGLYPYSKVYLRDIKERFGEYWKNHFNTIGLCGLNESLLNFLKKDIASDTGKAFAIKVLDFMRKKLGEFQKEDNQLYNLEATPAEGTSYSFAKSDKKFYPDIVVANEEAYRNLDAAPFYTNSSQLPVNYTDDLFEALDLQDDLQVKYTGGTVLHGFLGERLSGSEAVKALVKKITSRYRLPYFTLTPTFSVCPTHGYVSGEHFKCPDCKAECEVYSRVVGYLRPVGQWNEGKQAEFAQRKEFAIR